MKIKPEGSPVHIVIADHDVDWMMGICQELAGHSQLKEVGFAQTGSALMERVENMAVEVVLTEYSLPDTTAAEIAVKLSDSSKVAVFAVTKSLTTQIEQTAQGKGVVEVFSKDNLDPIQIAD